MAIISEDEAKGTGFWVGEVYQFHRAAGVTRELQTKAGPLPLDGTLEVGYARIAELRKGVGWGSVAHPRWSVRCEDVGRCEAVIVPLVLTHAEDGVLRDDRRVAPQLVPLALLGCKMEATLLTAGGAYVGDAFTLGARVRSHGGAPLRTRYLDDAAFEAKAMMAGGELPFEEMKLAQLKEELAARGSTRSGLKAVLQRRLHGLLVEAAIGAHRKRGREFAGSSDELSSSPGSDSEG